MNNQTILKKQFNLFKIKNIVIANSLVLVISSLIIKIISLINRVYLTRLLGNMGIAIYTLILPTIMLFISIGGFSLNNTVTKVVSENNNKYSDYEIIKISRTIAFLSSIITIIIFLISVEFIAKYALKQPDTIKPLLFTIIFIPLTALNNVYRGYASGKNQIKQTAIATVIEQLARFFLTIILLYAFNGFGTYFCVMLTIIAMCFGEGISLIYILTKIKKIPKQKTNDNKKMLIKKVYKLSLSTTLTHLISNVALFLEPIIFTYTLSNLNISNDQILLKYSEINSFVIPTLTLLSFISFQYSQAIFPVLTKNYSNNNKIELTNLINKSLFIMIIISIFIANVFYFFANDILLFLYDTNIGENIIKNLSYIFILSYLTPILIVFLQATNNYNYIFKCSLFCTIIKLLFIFIIGKTNINVDLILPSSITLSIVLSFILYLTKTMKIITIKLPLLKIIFMSLCSYLIFVLIITFNINFIISTLIALIIYFLFFLFL